MALQGSLTTMSVSDLLQFLAVSRKTGLLKFSHQKVLKGIYFENGIIVGSSTNDPKEYLGQVLMHYGKIDEAQLQAAMEIQRGEAAVPRSEGGKVQSSTSKVQSSGDEAAVQSPKSKVQSRRPRRLGQILVADGILSEEQVSQLLEIRTLDIIYDLFLWNEGQFEFGTDNPLPPDFTRVHVEANRVVMEGIHRADEMMRFRTLIPSDRTLLELGAGWTSSLPAGKATRQLLYFLEKRMSVEQLESLIFHIKVPLEKAQQEPRSRWVDPNVRAAQQDLERSLGVRVRIRDRRGKGKIVIEYATLEDFDRVLEMLKGK